MVVVHPAYQKRGHGRRLVQWGMELATKDKVGAGVIAAGKGKSLYGSLGFEKLGDLPFEDLGLSVMQYRANPLRLHLWLFAGFVLLVFLASVFGLVCSQPMMKYRLFRTCSFYRMC